MIKTLTTSAAMLALTVGLAMAQQGNPGAQMIEQWDLDADGVVTLEEARTKRGEVFFMFDVASDGILKAEDWVGVAEHLAAEFGRQGQGQGVGQGQGPGAVLRDAMTPEFNDANGDGQVTVAEFDMASDKLFAALDRTGDHLLTVDDFGR